MSFECSPKREALSSERMDVKIKRLHHDAKLPAYKTSGSRGADLCAVSAGVLLPSLRGAVACGFALEIPEGYGVMILPRSGLAHDHGVSVINSPGLIDSDFRGEIKVLLENRGFSPFRWKAGERIAQMALVELPQARFVVVDELGETARGEGGLGSTGR